MNAGFAVTLDKATMTVKSPARIVYGGIRANSVWVFFLTFLSFFIFVFGVVCLSVFPSPTFGIVSLETEKAFQLLLKRRRTYSSPLHESVSPDCMAALQIHAVKTEQFLDGKVLTDPETLKGDVTQLTLILRVRNGCGQWCPGLSLSCDSSLYCYCT